MDISSNNIKKIESKIFDILWEEKYFVHLNDEYAPEKNTSSDDDLFDFVFDESSQELC